MPRQLLTVAGSPIAFIALGCVLAQGGVLIEETFDNYATGLPPVPPWVHAGLITPSIVDTVYVGSSGRSLHFLDNSDVRDGQLKHELPVETSVVLEYYMRTHREDYEGVFVHLIGDVGPDYTVCFGNQSGGGAAGYIGVFGWRDGWVEPQLLPYAKDTWYYVRRTLQCATSMGTIYVEEVGNSSNKNTYTGKVSDNANTEISWVKMVTSESQMADCYIDEIQVTPEPMTWGLLALGSLGMLVRRNTRRRC